MTSQPDPALHAHAASAAPTQPPAERSVFDAAKSIVQTLADMKSKTEQERALRYAAEELDITLAAATSPPPHAPHHLTTPLPAAGGGPLPPGRAQDIRSFVQAKQPKSDNQFAAVVAYYYRFEAPAGQRRDSITPEFLQEATRQAGRERLGNPRATLASAVAMGYLDRAARGEFGINTVGENLVAMTLPGGGDNAGAGSRKRASRKKLGKKASKKARP